MYINHKLSWGSFCDIGNKIAPNADENIVQNTITSPELIFMNNGM